MNIVSKFKHEITYVIMNWQREAQVRNITKILKSQEMGCNIIIWNNNPDIIYIDKNADAIINVSTNFRCGAAIPLLMFSFSKYIIKLDDDLLPSNTAVQDTYNIIQELEAKYNNVVIGRDAESLTDPTKGVTGEVDFIKGRLMIFNREQINSLNLSFFNSEYDEFHHWELAICSQLRKSGNVIYGSSELFNIYTDVKQSADGNAAWREGSHMNNRKYLIQKHFN